jgi:hypothetical protein
MSRLQPEAPPIVINTLPKHVREAATAGPRRDTLAPFRTRLHEANLWQTATLATGLILCLVIWPFVAMLLSDAARRAELVGERPPFEGLGGGIFWLGMALVAISQIQAIGVAIREIHLAQDCPPPR